MDKKFQLVQDLDINKLIRKAIDEEKAYTTKDEGRAFVGYVEDGGALYKVELVVKRIGKRKKGGIRHGIS